MKRLLISYDLIRPGQDYDDLIEYLESYRHAKPLYSVWLIVTNKSAETVRDELKNKLLDSNDKVVVVDTTGDAAAWSGGVDWIKNDEV
jgi:hypothetical protein